MKVTFQKTAGDRALGIEFFWKMTVEAKAGECVTDHFISELFFDFRGEVNENGTAPTRSPVFDCFFHFQICPCPCSPSSSFPSAKRLKRNGEISTDLGEPSKINFARASRRGCFESGAAQVAGEVEAAQFRAAVDGALVGGDAVAPDVDGVRPILFLQPR